MKTGFEVYAEWQAQAQAFLGGEPAGGDRTKSSTLEILGVVIPCTCSQVLADWELQYGKSPTTTVEICQFLARDVPANVPDTNPAAPLRIEKGVRCRLRLNPGLPELRMQLWTGGLMSGGLVYRFMLVAEGYRG